MTFEFDGKEFIALNGGSFFKINEAVSFVNPCEDQKEVDYYEKLSANPETEVCWWLKDKFGVSWQLIPKEFDKMMRSVDFEKHKKAMEALLKMKRIEMAELKKAYLGN